VSNLFSGCVRPLSPAGLDQGIHGVVVGVSVQPLSDAELFANRSVLFANDA
jgi:hypothetical protein